MFYIIDIIILAIIALCAFIGYKQGLIKSAIKIFTFIIAIVVALTLYKTVAKLIIDNTEFDEAISNAITEKILPEGMSDDETVKQENLIKTNIVDTANKTVNEISQNIAIKIIEAASLLVIFIITKIILKLISALSALITKLPIIKQIDKSGGTIYGILKGVLIVCTIFAIINLVSPMLKDEWIDFINKTYIGGFLYNYNIILKILF